LRILILGGDGMLGHQLLRQWRERHDVRVTLRRDPQAYAGERLFAGDKTYYGVDAVRLEDLIGVFSDFRPEAVVNAVGIVKQQSAAKESIPSIEINALLPHRLAELCKAAGARFVHMSTDCVFAGRKGNYREDDPSDAEDLYGKSKYLGEVHEGHCLTLRTSIIGTELYRRKSLLEWFLAQKGPVKGYRQAIFSGFTTIEMSRVIERLLVRHPQASGLYHVSSAPINKLDLLTKIKGALGLAVQIDPDASVCIDRSLDSGRFRREFDYTPPTWDEMTEELANDIKRGGR
jgi:dTDP-4-dehydrorhamnose reductase